VKVIICGSSKKFFQQKSQKNSTDEAVLRSLKNHTLPEVLPFTPKEVKDLFFPTWDYEKIVFLYMITGGIPYYLDRIKSDKPFLTAINDAIFVSTGIFLDELDEMLKLEFSKGSRDTIVNILSNIGQDGAEFHSLKTKTGLPDSTLKETLDKLYDYEILFKKYPMNLPPKGKNRNHGVRYYMKDFFLNFYFQVLMFYESRIKLNTQNGLIFSADSLDSQSGYYINDFTGHAFELFCQYFFENVKDLNLQVYKKMNIRTLDFKVGTYWNKETQVDLIIEDHNDRNSRIIECKWVNSTTKYADYLDEIADKSYIPPAGMDSQKVLILAQKPSISFLEKAKANNTIIISIEDFFQ
jgi:AAA+ ATPase superfamily predicted ATPase